MPGFLTLGIMLACKPLKPSRMHHGAFDRMFWVTQARVQLATEELLVDLNSSHPPHSPTRRGPVPRGFQHSCPCGHGAAPLLHLLPIEAPKAD